jgi:hypothetical protein
MEVVKLKRRTAGERRAFAQGFSQAVTLARVARDTGAEVEDLLRALEQFLRNLEEVEKNVD